VRLISTMVMFGLAACSAAQTVPASESYSVLLMDDGQTWCAYRSPSEFETEAMRVMPTESVRLTYTANRLSELTHQVEAESGDWIVIDRYTLADGGATLRRATLLAQANRQVIQEAVIQGDTNSAFRVVSVSTLDGTRSELPPNVDLPELPVSTDLSVTPFARIVRDMRDLSIGKLCKKMD
jgi:hypothetical protein